LFIEHRLYIKYPKNQKSVVYQNAHKHLKQGVFVDVTIKNIGN